MNKHVILWKVLNRKLKGKCPIEKPRVRCKEQVRKGDMQKEVRKCKKVRRSYGKTG
jgi:hypothetical protein